MDTSKEYIEMCRKAVEIQELWKCDWGDFYSFEGNYQVVPLFSGEFEQGFKKRCIWLPRQDQLQEIIFERYVGWEINKPDRLVLLCHARKVQKEMEWN